MFRFLKKQNALLSLLLVLPLIGQYGGKAQMVSEVSPYSIAMMELDKKVFRKVALQKNYEDFMEEQRIRNQIVQIMSQYQKGLDDRWKREIPATIIEESQKYGYDPLLLTALIITESSFNLQAKSNRGAMGLMQLVPGTGLAMARETRIAWNGNPSLYEPETNIALGAYYLKKLENRFQDMELALEAYNHGPTNLSRYLQKGIAPYEYSSKVYEIYDRIRTEEPDRLT